MTETRTLTDSVPMQRPAEGLLALMRTSPANAREAALLAKRHLDAQYSSSWSIRLVDDRDETCVLAGVGAGHNSIGDLRGQTQLVITQENSNTETPDHDESEIATLSEWLRLIIERDRYRD